MYDRVYKFYDPTDENDSTLTHQTSVLSPVIGQLIQKAHIAIDPNVKLKLAETPNRYYDEWTISYISPELFYEEGRDDNILRAFTEAKHFLFTILWLVRLETSFKPCLISTS